MKYKPGDRVDFLLPHGDGTDKAAGVVEWSDTTVGNYTVRLDPKVAGYCEFYRITDRDIIVATAGGPDAGGHPEYLKLLDEMRELHVRKAADYGRGVDPLANVRAAADFGIPAWVGVVVRANDKMHRIKSFLQNGTLKNESVEDSLKDLSAYALIALVLYREESKK